VLLENVLRNYDGKIITETDVTSIANWPTGINDITIPYLPGRVLLQDLTGIPLIVDMAAIRDAVHEHGGDASKINPLNPVDLVIDHSVQVDYYGVHNSIDLNLVKEYERNRERYLVIKWMQNSFKNTRVVPTGSGICHQVNLEYLAKTIDFRMFDGDDTASAFPDTCVGTDSHTPMVNGLSVVGFGVGGIEAEAVMLGQPYFMPLPEVIGIKLTGSLPEGSTATDIVLKVTNVLREYGAVGKFVEFFGPGLVNLSVPDRAMIANMTPEHGCTITFFPIDTQTIDYLQFTGRDPKHVEFVEKYAKLNNMFRTDDMDDPEFCDIIEIDLNKIKPSVAGPLNPDEHVLTTNLPTRLEKFMDEHFKGSGRNKLTIDLKLDDKELKFTEGDLAIAAITSCTNTSNPTVLIGAGLLARNAVKQGLRVRPTIKTSLAPGSKVVTDYLDKTGLTPYLEALGFMLVGYGCTTCIGNSGPLREEIAKVIVENDLYVTSISSGNRNFSGRIHNLTRGNFLGSPMLVVAYALAGTMNIDITNDPISYDPNGKAVYLKDIWPSLEEIEENITRGITPAMFEKQYAEETITLGDPNWQKLKAPTTTLFEWDPNSTYICKPPYFSEKFFSINPQPPQDILGANALIVGEDKVSTDHISPAGAIAKESPAAKYLEEQKERIFNTYGSRRGNHEVMMRGTFANVRFRNQLTPDKEGWYTKYIPTGEVTSVYEAAMKYEEENQPTVILGSALYGVGSSRDWAAKGPALLGVKAVLAKSFERIHRSNLIGMGVLPLEYDGWDELKLDGTEAFDIIGLSDGLTPKQEMKVNAHKKDGETIEFKVTSRLDAPIEIEYYRYGGILQYLVVDFLK
jgi:aconitate hydratase